MENVLFFSGCLIVAYNTAGLLALTVRLPMIDDVSMGKICHVAALSTLLYMVEPDET